ncbi:hypothetical protein SDC9_131185 [bioreactor metagenome]|uniref:Uncharacterized protein n=1 Tax=bioreactor metagenome TaxID=1076179 RepID=A0A645D462_9ZZZZ
MRIKDHRVSCGDHADCVVDHRRGWVGGGCDRADHAIGCGFDQREPIITRKRLRMEVFDAGCLFRSQNILCGLVRNAAVARLFVGKPSERFRMLERRFAHGFNQSPALFQREFDEFLLRGFRVCNRFLRRVVEPAALGARGLMLKFCQRFTDDAVDLRIRICHIVLFSARGSAG